MLSHEDHRPAVHVRIAAFEAGDFNTVTLLVSDKQHSISDKDCPRERQPIDLLIYWAIG